VKNRAGEGRVGEDLKRGRRRRRRGGRS